MADPQPSGSWLKIGPTLGDAVAIFQRRRITVVLLALLLLGVPSVLLDLSTPPKGPLNFADLGPAFWGALILATACSLIFQGAALQLAVDDRHGRRPAFAESFHAGFVHAPALLMTGLLVTFGFLAGLMLLVVPGVIFAVAAFVATAVTVVEKPGAVESLTRSATLTRGVRLPILGLWSVFLAAGLMVGIVGGMVVGAFTSLGEPGRVIGSAIGAAMGSILSAFMTLAVAVVYFRLSDRPADLAPAA